MQINSAKLIVEILDETTGELITREATLGDFKEVTKKSTTSRVKKPKDDNPNPQITLLEGKWQMNNACVQLTGFEPEQKLEIKFEKKGRVITPVLCEDEKSGNRLTKTYTVSCRGSKHDNLAEYGTIFDVIPYEENGNIKPGYFRLKGDAPEKEDDIIDIPQEIADPDEQDDLELDSNDEGVEINFDLDL